MQSVDTLQINQHTAARRPHKASFQRAAAAPN